MSSLSFQRTLHWLELGQGKRIIQYLGMIIFVFLFTWYHCSRRFGGPKSENIIEQALIARHLSEGKGFTTPVKHPQVAAFMEARDENRRTYDSSRPWPDLYHAPLYPLVLAGGLKLMWPELTAWVWEDPISETLEDYPAYHADYYLLAVNVLFYWIACFLTFCVARSLFSAEAGVIALLGMLLSVGIWDQVLAVSGVSLLMVLVLLAFWLWSAFEKFRLAKDGSPGIKACLLVGIGIGVINGLLFLTEYTAGFFGLVFIAYCLRSLRGKELFFTLLPAALIFVLSITGWGIRNFELTGHPLALAWQNLPLKAGDPTAEPAMIKNRFEAKAPPISLYKIFGKGLKGVEINLTQRVWAAGGYLFSAFFFVGCLYRFRKPEVNTMRWSAVATVVFLLLIQPFFNSGVSERLPAYYLTPLLIIFGTGFFLVLLKSTVTKGAWERIGIMLLMILLHSAPLVHNLTEPRRVHFHFPPYIPSFMVLTRTALMDKLQDRYELMADVPAGLAWYSRQSVWGQPVEYADFVEIFTRYDIGALFLSPGVLDKPYFSNLLMADLDVGEDFNKTRYWGAVYGSLQSGKIPEFFPLQISQQLRVNMYMLINAQALTRK